MGVVSCFSTLLTCKVLDPEPGRKRQLPEWKTGKFQYNWIGILIIGVPVAFTLLGMLLGVRLRLSTFLVLAIYAIITGIVGVTAGYHRLYSHKCYTASPFMLKLTAFVGAGAFQGSIKWWARLHRIHHKYTDTDKDPYDARRGFWFTHIGWFVMRMDYDLLGNVDTSDLDASPVVTFQRDNFAILAVVSGILLPWFTAGLLFNDWAGGFFYAVFLKMLLIHQATFCINSLVHTNWFWSKQNYDDTLTPHDSIIFAIFTFGEGYHNYHHAFANDYRNGFRWYHVDPTKWYIYVCEKLGFCWDLIRTPDTVIERAHTATRVSQIRKELLLLEREAENEEPAVTEVWTKDEVERLVKEDGRKLIIVEGYVLDLDKPIVLEANKTHAEQKINWYDSHPGGKKFLDAYIGRDATEAMRGGVYKHSHGAQNYVPELRVAHLKTKAG